MTKILIDIPDDWFDAIAKERGDVDRSTWIRAAIRKRLKDYDLSDPPTVGGKREGAGRKPAKNGKK